MKERNHRIRLLSVSFAALVALLALSSCQNEKDLFRFVKGTPVRFGVISSGSSLTRAAYSGGVTGNVERIDWTKDDRIRIYCEASDDKWADYVVIEDSTKDQGAKSVTAIASYDGKELHWGSSTDPHTFYAVYPSPGFNGITESIADNVVTGNLPSTDQGKKGDVKESDGNYVVTPDLKWMMMTAKAGPYTEGIPDDGTVFLSFQPLMTAIEFTIENGFATGGDLGIKSISLTSKEHSIAGKFTVDIAKLDADGKYPVCTSGEDSKTVTIALPDGFKLCRPDAGQPGDSLKLTFFLKPSCTAGETPTAIDIDDLTFRITKSDDSWIQTRLGYTDGSGVEFPCHKKTFVKGLLVPEGAQWTVKYGPTVDPWTSGGGDIYPSPEMQMGETTLVTSWDTGEEKDLNFSGESDPIKWIDLGLPSGTLWASKNIGSMKDTDPGYYFSWGNTSGYKRNASNTGWISASDNTPFENGFTNDNYSTTSGASRASDFMSDATYDAATAEYGTDYATADLTAYRELKDACYWVKCDGKDIKYKGSKVNGYIVYKRKSGDESTTYDKATAGVEYTEDDTHIFIPIGGYGNGDGIAEGGINGFLWTSTLVDSNNAQNIKLHDDENDGSGYVKNILNYRYYGFNIRAVKPGSHPVVKIGGSWWSTKNIGASKPEQSGWYFTWGGTIGYKRNADKTGWISASDGKNTKYSFTGGNYKYTGTSIDNSHDAAYQIWGSSWKMPGKSNFQSLWEASYIVFNSDNSNFYFFAKDASHPGKTIVNKLPSGWNYSDALMVVHASGYAYENGLSGGSVVYLWSKTYSTAEKCKSLYLKYGDTTNSGYDANGWRYTGFPIRPIHK